MNPLDRLNYGDEGYDELTGGKVRPMSKSSSFRFSPEYREWMWKYGSFSSKVASIVLKDLAGQGMIALITLLSVQ